MYLCVSVCMSESIIHEFVCVCVCMYFKMSVCFIIFYVCISACFYSKFFFVITTETTYFLTFFSYHLRSFFFFKLSLFVSTAYKNRNPVSSLSPHSTPSIFDLFFAFFRLTRES